MLMSLYGVLHLSSVQSWITQEICKKLSRELHTKISIGKVNFEFFDKLQFNNLLIEDQSKDSLLYSGRAIVEINDWFFLQNKIIIKNIELTNTSILLKRKDANWNYHFLESYFGSSQNSKKNNTKNNIQFECKHINIENFQFKQTDQWTGENINFELQKADISIHKIDLEKQIVEFKNVDFIQPNFVRLDYQGLKPANYHSTSKIKSENSKNEWTIRAQNIDLKNGVVRNDRATERLPFTNQFDGLHILFHSIDANLKNVQLTEDTLTANIILAAKERSGFEVKKISANYKFTPQQMEFAHLDLVTNKSHIKDYFSMNYHSFNADMNDFINKVSLNGSFKSSEVSSNDIGYFAPELNNWNRLFKFTGVGNGTIDDLYINNLNVQSKQSYITGNINFKHLASLEKLSINFSTNESRTSFAELTEISPSLNNIDNPTLSKLGSISFKGTFNGTLQHFLTNGKFSTNMGKIEANIEMLLPEKSPPTYSGTISTDKFYLNKLLDNNNLGSISLRGKINGTGFSTDDIHNNFTGHISSLFLHQYNYSNIDIDGSFDKNKFEGHLTIDDPNIKANNINGTILLHQKDINIQLLAEVNYSRLKELNFSKSKLDVTGLFNMNFTGNNIDDFLGEARANHLTITTDTKKLQSDFVLLSSVINNNIKTLAIQSPEIAASISGKFKIKELPNAFKVFLSKYYPNYITTPSTSLSNQDFSFTIKSFNIEDYLKLVDPKISGCNDADISGSLNLESNQLTLHAQIPKIGYDNKTFSNVNIDQNGNADTLHTNISIGDIHFFDSAHIPNTTIHIKSNNDNSEINVKTTAIENFNDAELNANLTTLSDGIKVHFYPSSFYINEKKWDIEKDGELVLRKNFINANDIRIAQDSQSILLSSELDELTEKQRLNIQINNLILGDLVPILFKDPEIEGKLTGNASINNPIENPTIQFSGNIDSLKLNNKKIGTVQIKANTSTENKSVTYEAKNIDSTNIFSLSGNYNYSDSVNEIFQGYLDGQIIQLSILEPYLNGIFDDIQGVANSKLKLSVSKDHQYLTGDVNIDSANCVVGFTKCKYLINHQTIHFTNDAIDLNLLQLSDTLNNKVTLNGKINHHLFDDIYFNNLKLESSKISLLNTKKNDNEAFYGNMIGRATLSINGPIQNTQIDIDGEPSILDSSHIFISTSDSKESTSKDYIEFIEFGTLVDNKPATSNNNIVCNLNIKANPSCKVDVILDEETGDIIKGQGDGLIKIKVGTIEPLSIRGTYKLSKGEYNFNFQTFLQKPFTLNSGGTINWNGNPYEANIDIYAEYLAKNVDISSLSNTSGFKQKEDIKIISHLTGILQNPMVKFDLELPERSEVNRDEIIVKRLAQFKTDDNEMNKQVASLILFNTFILGNQNFLTQGNASTLITNTIGGVVSSLLTNLLNRELEKATKGMLSTYIDINPTLDLQKSASQIQANIRAGLKILLSNRLIMLVGGNLDYNNPTYSQQLEKKGLLTPDITIEWMVNRDGTIRIVGFNRSSIDLSLNQRNRSGLQLSYRKDANKISDIFKKQKKK